jgi:LPS-assembly protein
MLRIGVWMLSPLLLLPLRAQEPEALAEETPSPPAADMNAPVAPPDLSFGLPDASNIETPKSLKIDNYGGGVIEGNKDNGVRYFGPGIKITTDTGMEAFSDRVTLDLKDKSVILEGNVSIYQGNMLQRGERAVYFYERKYLEESGLRASLDPILLEAGKFTSEEQDGTKVFVGEDGGITTDDSQDPGYWLKAKKTTVFPGDKIVFNDLSIYAGDVPVFWFPYLSQPLNKELGYHFLPGARSSWGPFLLNTYGLMLGGKTDPQTGEKEDAWLLSRWHFDILSKRGVGLGTDLVDKRVESTTEMSGLSFYYIYDIDPETSTTGVPRGDIDPNRYRVELKHRQELDFPDTALWQLDSNLSLLSDQYYLEDFDIAQYRYDPAPDNTLGLFRKDDHSLLSIYGRFRINDFYRTDTRSPEIFFDQARAPLFDSPVLHEGNVSFAYIGEQAADLAEDTLINPLLQLKSNDATAQSLLKHIDPYERKLVEELLSLPVNDPKREALRTQLLDSSYTRFNIYQELSAPLTFKNAFYVTPIAGVGYTRYDNANWTIANADRTYFHAGTEFSTKFSKDFGGNQSHEWGLDGLKHILQPYANWSFVATDNYAIEDPQVDRLTPTTRPRPLDPVRFNALDELQSWNVVRMGARNRWLTKRDGQAMEWLYLETYCDAFIQDPEGQRDFSNLYNELRWQPLPWLSGGVEVQFPIISDGSGFNEYNTNLRFMPTSNFEFTFNYMVLTGHPILNDSNQIYLQSYLRLNDYWGFGTLSVIELDDGTLQEQRYSIHRDLGNWVAGLGLTAVDNRLQTEYGILFSLTLKDFPAASLPFEISGE